jgi:hypothetical protein
MGIINKIRLGGEYAGEKGRGGEDIHKMLFASVRLGKQEQPAARARVSPNGRIQWF